MSLQQTAHVPPHLFHLQLPQETPTLKTIIVILSPTQGHVLCALTFKKCTTTCVHFHSHPRLIQGSVQRRGEFPPDQTHFTIEPIPKPVHK
ncbi:hypothetical protein E2542_SST16005 [Spatholobus suberectus]|nr:hypothetical protein E2542_SST16005 [Spatholobus suberectus]